MCGGELEKRAMKALQDWRQLAPPQSGTATRPPTVAYAKWKLSRNMCTLRTRFCTLDSNLYAQSVLANKISACRLRRKFTKGALLLVGQRDQYILGEGGFGFPFPPTPTPTPGYYERTRMGRSGKTLEGGKEARNSCTPTHMMSCLTLARTRWRGGRRRRRGRKKVFLPPSLSRIYLFPSLLGALKLIK